MKKLSVLMALSLFAVPVAYAQDGLSCAGAIPLTPGVITVDTTAGAPWINNFGPLVSPSNDIVYTFTTGDAPATGTITATAANYSWAIYLLNSCTAGAGPTPIAATTVIGTPMSLAATLPNTQYWVAVTGTAAGGPGANGSVTIDVTPTLPVTLQSFEID